VKGGDERGGLSSADALVDFQATGTWEGHLKVNGKISFGWGRDSWEGRESHGQLTPTPRKKLSFAV